MEHVELGGPADPGCFGRALARLHRHTAGQHGWNGANWLGGSRQDNRPMDDWSAFWWQRRLQPQFDAAIAAGVSGMATAADRVERHLADWLAGHEPRPSQLHGDLWAGNHGYDTRGRPVIFDPASWYGDRETDLAMMSLFGGYPAAVFDAYNAAWPLPEGHERRRLLYQLYHLLNHLNLFGTGWLGRVQSTLDQLQGP